MSFLKSLLKDTALYGLTSLVGRFLNYLLVPVYTKVMPAVSGEYGVVTNMYAYTALILAVLTFGMETTFFRFANKAEENPRDVYSTALLTVGGLSLLFLTLVLTFLTPISQSLGYGAHPEYIAIMAIIVAIDAFACIPFSYLRYQQTSIAQGSTSRIPNSSPGSTTRSTSRAMSSPSTSSLRSSP